MADSCPAIFRSGVPVGEGPDVVVRVVVVREGYGQRKHVVRLHQVLPALL